MPERRLDDPASMVGASVDEIRALKPEGWIERPMPGARAGFRLISVGKLPGVDNLAVHGEGNPGWRQFEGIPEPVLFVLNSAIEAHPLSTLMKDLGGDENGVVDDTENFPVLARVTANAVSLGHITLWEDDLVSERLRLVEGEEAIRVISNPLNWWRDENDADVPHADRIYLIDITPVGLAEFDRRLAPSPKKRFWQRGSKR